MPINRTILAWTRTIHIYLTMAALALMLFFAVTGFTVNHEDWLRHHAAYAECLGDDTGGVDQGRRTSCGLWSTFAARLG